MRNLHYSSLGSVVDSMAESLFFAQKIPASECRAAAKGIAARQGLPGAYAGMFAPTNKDARGFRLFTGEVVRSRVGTAHLLGEEACRILAVLQVKDPAVSTALQRATAGMVARLDESEQQGLSIGTYCCGTCSVGYWRNLALGLFPRAEERLRQGMRELKESRRGGGRWHRFPFFYTCLALTEIGPDLAGHEMRYAAASWQRILPRLSRAKDPQARRRAAVGRRLLAWCDS